MQLLGIDVPAPPHGVDAYERSLEDAFDGEDGRARRRRVSAAEKADGVQTSVDYPIRAPREFLKPEPTFAELRHEKGGVVGAAVAVGLRHLKRHWGVLAFLLFLQVGLAMLGVFAFDDLRWQAWASFVIVTILLSVLVVNLLPPEIAMCAALTTMMALKIVTPAQGMEGFSNTGVGTVAVLFVVADGIQRTSVLLPLFRLMLGKPTKLWVAQLRLMLPVAIISAFLNNTPVVAMLITVVQSWSRRAGFPISKLLMPLNNAAILGGTMTLIGTSTNLVVDGLARKAKIADFDGKVIELGLFDITPIGCAILFIGILYMLLFSRCLIRERGSTGVGAIIKNPREYTVPLLVTGRSPIVGETIAGAGLRQLQGLYLVEITRDNGDVVAAAPPDTVIQARDILLFAGIVETVSELYTNIPGLEPATNQSKKMTQERHRRRLVELVISPSSFLTGKTAKEAHFRSRFDAAIIAVHRHGEHVKDKIADIRLAAGDTLLVETSEDFFTHYSRDANFALVSEVSGSTPPRSDVLHMIISAVVAAAMVGAATAGVMDLLPAAALGSIVLVSTGCISVRDASSAVNIPVIVTIAASFGVARGMELSGAGDALASFIVDTFKGLGTLGLLFGIYFGTAMLSSLLTNTAAVSLSFPIITTILKQEQNLSGRAVLYTLMIGASSSFSTPIGYQTNLMVHGPGGYTFSDWVVFGLPLQIIVGITGVLIINVLNASQ